MSHPLETLRGRRGAVAAGELELRPTPAGTHSCRRRRRAGSPQEVRGVLAGPEEGQPFLHTQQALAQHQALPSAPGGPVGTVSCRPAGHGPASQGRVPRLHPFKSGQMFPG